MEPRPAQTAQEVLMYACFTNNQEYAKMALYRKVNAHFLGEKYVNDGKIPGFEALPEIDKLDINYKEPRQGNATPLLLCARKGHTEIAQQLINLGADVNLCANGNVSPLHQAMTHHHYEIAIDLLQAGAFPVDEISKNSPYLHTCLNKRACELLLLTGADANQKDKDGNAPLLTICSSHPIPELVPTIEYLQIIMILVDFGADIQAKDKDNQTAIDLITSNFNIEEDEKNAIVSFLVSHGAEKPVDFEPVILKEEKGNEQDEKLIAKLFEQVKENRMSLKTGDIDKASEGFTHIEKQIKDLHQIKSSEGKKKLAICYNELAFHQYTSPEQLDKLAKTHLNPYRNWQTAVEYYLKALKLFYDIGNEVEFVNARLNHLNALVNTGQQIKIDDVLTCREVLKDDKRIVKAEKLIKILKAEESNEFANAKDILLENKEEEDKEDPVEIANNLAEIGEVSKALNARIDLIQKDPNLVNLHNISESLLHAGKFEDANKHQRDALNGFIEQENALGVINGLSNLAHIARCTSDYKSALEYHEQELSIALELKDPECLAESYWNQSLTYFHMKNYDKAFMSASKGAEFAYQSNNQKWISTCGMQALFMEFAINKSSKRKLFKAKTNDDKAVMAKMAVLQKDIIGVFALGDWIGGAYLACIAQKVGVNEISTLMDTSLALAKGNGHALAVIEIEQLKKQGFWKD